jgi:hypothetical protein
MDQINFDWKYILIVLLISLFLFYYGDIMRDMSENFSDNRVNYPFDAYPELFPSSNPKFLYKLPYDNLTTRHYKQIWSNKTSPKCIRDGNCERTPGYFKTYPDYFDHPKKLQSLSLGYSVTGYPYNDYKFRTSQSEKKSGINLAEPVNNLDNSEWLDYENTRQDAMFTGYPFNFGGKLMR